MKMSIFTLACALVLLFSANAQNPNTHKIFEKQPINFGGDKGSDTEAVSLMSNRLVYKKVTLPTFINGPM